MRDCAAVSAPAVDSRPRDAASLAITRGRGADARVLLGRREPRDRFLPDMYVFPGGRVDRADATRPAATELRPEVAARLHSQWPGPLARALAVACLRETHEETGLALGPLADGRLLPELHRLDYVARAITPALNPIRYHARFFHAAVDSAGGALLGSGELLDLEWRGFDETLELPMLDVTTLVLRTVARRVGHPAGAEPGSPEPGRIPFIHYRATVRRVRYE